MNVVGQDPDDHALCFNGLERLRDGCQCLYRDSRGRPCRNSIAAHRRDEAIVMVEIMQGQQRSSVNLRADLSRLMFVLLCPTLHQSEERAQAMADHQIAYMDSRQIWFTDPSRDSENSSRATAARHAVRRILRETLTRQTRSMTHARGNLLEHQTAAALNNLSTRIRQTPDPEEENSSEIDGPGSEQELGDCSICISEIGSAELKSICFRRCEAVFHAACLNRWFEEQTNSGDRRSCPH